MTLIATSIWAALPLLFVLACPLMMIFMMRGMHGGHAEAKPRDRMTLDELTAERDVLNEEIGQRAERRAQAIRTGRRTPEGYSEDDHGRRSGQ